MVKLWKRGGLWRGVASLSLIFAAGAADAQKRATSAGAEMLLSDDRADQIVVTASRVATRSGDAPSAVTVFTEKDIRAMGATTLLDVLRYAPGLDVFQLNRSDSNVSVRGLNGLNSNKLLIMVDGRSIYEDVNGGIVWPITNFLISRIKRIEIVRGTGSALYGANAFNGVINIITKTPHELANAPSRTSLRAVVGEQGTTLNELLTSTPTTSGWDFTFGAGYNRADGYGERKPGAVRDSYTTPILTLDAQKKMKRGSFQIALGQSEAREDYSQTGLSTLLDLHLHNSYVMAQYGEEKVKNPVTARLFTNYYLSALPVNSLLPPTPGGSAIHLIDSTTFDFDLQQQRKLSPQHNAVYGANYRSILLRSQVTDITNAPRKHQQELYALYFQDDFRFSRKTHLFIGLRFDENSQYGFNFTPRLSLLHTLSKAETLRLSYGTSFRSPTLLETYQDFILPMNGNLALRLRGNRDLKPERVSSFELGYRRAIPGGFIGANAFYNKYTDLIDFRVTQTAPSPPFPLGLPTELTYFNQGGARIAGVELESQFRLGGRAHGLFNYAYQNAEDDAGNPLSLTPNHKVNLGVAMQFSPRWDAYLGAHYVDAVRVTSGPVTTTLPPYIRVDARVGYRFGAKNHPMSVSVIATDLFDSKHLEYPDFSATSGVKQVAPQRRTLYLMFEGKF